MNVSNESKEKSYLRPLFWQHGESEEVLVEEIEQMHQKGIGGFIVEARPHPDFLSYGWWRDLDIIIEAAQKRSMEVWIFDDSSYPSGLGAGKIKMLYPEYVKCYLAEHHIDVCGPRNQASINVKAWLEPSVAEGVHNLDSGEAEELICVLMAKRKNGQESLDVDSIIDLTSSLQQGKIIVDVPEGNWRIFIITKTKNGGEEWTKDYVNPLSREATAQFIDMVYEEHYKRYADEFGHTIKGFFTDEPRFGNAAGYEGTMWKSGAVYPYVDGLVDLLSEEYGKEFAKYLPFLWSNEDEICRDVHYCYMNVVSKMFSENFMTQIGDWCRNHSVQFIGHMVEDNGVHARLGYGAGHFFRNMEGMDAAGMDLVYQVWPNQKEGRYTTPFGYLNAEFFYWGISKMTSSAAHIDPKKEGIALCEIFGAYGWQLGLKFMKWLTDHVCVRGINLLVPHAFTPREHDPDCPPHFYARGKNPQWQYFDLWSGYTNRVCGLLSEGIHRATAAVLYHAEAEWGGEYEPFEKVVRVLAESQIDSDIIPADYLIDEGRRSVSGEKLSINQEQYEVLIIPYMQCISEELLENLVALSDAGLPILFMNGYPETVYKVDGEDLLEKLQASKAEASDYSSIISWLKDRQYYDVLLDDYNSDIRCYHYEKDEQNLYFITNESTVNIAKHYITMPDGKSWIAYDAMEDKKYRLEKNEKGYCYIELEPYQSIFIIEEKESEQSIPKRETWDMDGAVIALEDEWEITVPDANLSSVLEQMFTLRNLAAPDGLPNYSGEITYKTEFKLEKNQLTKKACLHLGEVYEICDVTLNDQKVGSKIVPPYRFHLSNLLAEENRLEIKVVNTNVHEKGDNYFDRSMVQEPSGLLGPVRIVLE